MLFQAILQSLTKDNMAKIPQPISQASILTGGVSLPQNQQAYGDFSGLASLGRAVGNLGESLVINKKTRDEIERRAKQKEDDLWVAKALSEYGRNLTDYEVNPENASRVDYLPGFLETADSQSTAFIENAPSAEAADKFSARARDIVDSRYGRSAERGAVNEMQADIADIDDSWGTNLHSYHNLAAQDPTAAADDLLLGLSHTTDNIVQLYGEMAPELAKKMIAQKIEDAALALSEKSPELAKNLLTENSVYIDEQRRQILLNKIESRKEETGLLLKEDFNTTREKLLIAAERTGEVTSLPLEDYQAIFPGEQAQVMKQRDDNKLAASNSAHVLISKMRGLKPEDKLAMAKEWENTLETEDQLQAAARIVGPALQRDRELYTQDRVQWLKENNTTLQTLEKDIAMLSENEIGFDTGSGVLPSKPGSEDETLPREAPLGPDQKTVSKEQYYKAILKYQGVPSEGEDPSRFLGLPQSERHLLTRGEAETLSAKINGADIDTAISTIKSILDEYPTDELRAQVIQDLTVLPKEKIRPEIQLAFQNADQSWLPQFIGNLRGVKELEAMAEPDKAELRASIQSNPLWASFYKSVLGPQNQRSGELEGYFSAIELNARAMMSKGLSKKEAAKASITQLLTSTMKPVDIESPDKGTPGFWRDSKQLWIARKPQGYDRPLSDQEMDDVGRRLSLAIATVHPDDVDPTQFAWAQQTTDKGKQKQLIHEKIVKTGQYYPEPGGRYYRLTVESEVKGDRIDLRNKKGEFFRVDIGKLPAYTTNNPSLNIRGINPSNWQTKTKEERITLSDDYSVLGPVDDAGIPLTGKFWEYAK